MKANRCVFKFHLLGALLVLAAANAARAGQACEAQTPTADAVARGMALAQTTAQRLDASSAQVVVIARAGQDLSKWGLRWSHLGFAYRADEASPWRIVHKLNQCNSDQAAVYRQGLGEFFLDQPHRYEAAYIELSAATQARLLPLLQDNDRVARWHEPRYNMLAYPWHLKYQQSNQWAIETLAGALDSDAGNRAQAQTWLQLRGYTPTTLRIGALTRLGANVSRANISFDDHPNSKRYADRIETVTVDSVFAWLLRSGLSTHGPVVVRAD